MPVQPSPGQPAVSVARAAFAPAEWQLLTRLPGRVVAAAAGAATPDRRPTVARALAGLDAVAAGRMFDSDLVRAVAAAIYATAEERPGTTPAAGGPGAGGRAAPPPAPALPPAPARPWAAGGPRTGDRRTGGPPAGEPANLLSDCRRAARLLADRADPADSAAYCHWLQTVAARAGGALRPGCGPPEPVRTDAGRAFLAALGDALGPR